MKQKVVLKVAMKCQKCRTRSLEVAAEQQVNLQSLFRKNDVKRVPELQRSPNVVVIRAIILRLKLRTRA